MLKYSCVIVDDETLARELLMLHIAKIPNLEVVDACSNAIDAKFSVEKFKPDILFLDIHMPNLSGIDLLKLLKQPPLTILTTAYSEYALEGYALDVVDYLLKPIEFDRFFKAVAKAMDLLVLKNAKEKTVEQTPPELPAETYFFAKVDYKMVRIEFESILFVEALQKYIRIHTENERFVILMSMVAAEELLPCQTFIRIHRSYITNIHKINSIEGNLVSIGKHRLPISKGYREAFLQKIQKK